MTRVMYDSVTVNEIPSDATAVAGYVDGNFRTWSQLSRFKANKLSIAVSHTTDAAALDCEPGDVPPSEVAAWVKRQLAHGQYRPVVYASRDTFPEILPLLTANGIKRTQYRIWSAHYSHLHICGSLSCGASFEADATQWTDRALGRNLDESVLRDDFFPPAPVKKPKIKKPAKPVRKVTAAALAASVATAVQAAVHGKGLAITPAEASAIATAAAAIAGYFIPAKKKAKT